MSIISSYYGWLLVTSSEIMLIWLTHWLLSSCAVQKRGGQSASGIAVTNNYDTTRQIFSSLMHTATDNSFEYASNKKS
jgi:hypothetical protein